MFAPNSIMNIKDHYDRHLSHFYAWMSGDFQTKSDEFKDFLERNHIAPKVSGVALDLGAGNGIQSAAMARAGFKVTAIDFCPSLLEQLANNTRELRVTAIESDIRSVNAFEFHKPELIVCAGDTLSHLKNSFEVEDFLSSCYDTLVNGGNFILSFRDYTTKLSDEERFIPVKSDSERILTCFLEYTPTHVQVTDILQQYDGNLWHQTLSSYTKVRITAPEILELLDNLKMNILLHTEINRMHFVIARK